MDRTVYCARGRTPHPAAYLVAGPGRQEVVCADHLAASQTWAGPRARTEPLPDQPANPPDGTQPTLF